MELKLNYYSKTIKTDVDISVFYPNPLEKSVNLIWLFPGLGARKQDYILNREIQNELTKKQNIVMVAVDGYRSFYQNMEHGYNYYDLIAKEITEQISNLLAFEIKSEHIIGISMGGYGAFYHALNQVGRFKQVISIAGSVNIVARDKVKRRLNNFITEEWINIFGNKLAEDKDLFKYPAESFPNKVVMFCGRQDHLYADNQLFVKHLQKIGVKVQFNETDGKHEYDYFKTTIIKAIKQIEE